MSPLARIRQVAACSAWVFFAGFALAAEPPTQPVQAVQAPQQPVQPAQPQPAQPQPAQPRPAQPVRLAPNATARIAHSALLSADGTASADTLRLSIRRVTDKSLVSSDDVTVTVDGRSEPVTRASGSYEVPINGLRGSDDGRDVEIIVAHDGIREILSGKVALAEAATADSLLRDHKQVAWWILNIVIVLVAAIAISRRKG
jgi:hypothetical protein